LAEGNVAAARAVLESARARGDHRKEVFGPLIQALIAQSDHARAAAVALDCEEQISTEDLRQLAGMTLERAPSWGGRLSEIAFKRESVADDAFDAARGFARAGDVGRAVDLLRRAFAAGFSDIQRVKDDDTLGKLELPHDLEALVMRAP
jgi:hypothetical protein